MKILVLNSGSSSIKFQLFLMEEEKSVASGLVEAIGDGVGRITIKDLVNDKKEVKELEISDHEHGLNIVQEMLKEMNILDSLDTLDGIGHRIVQGADLYTNPTLVTPEVVEGIEKIAPLAPLHNPAHLKGLRTALKQAPHVPEVVVFDTAYHQSLPPKAYMYAIGYDMYEKHKIRKYGFHGTSHYFVAKTAAKHLGIDFDKFNAITLHLGNGASISAIENGKSVDTSMGFTPLEGLVMGTRSGDIDPSVLNYIAQKTGKNLDELNNYLNKECGFKGLCGNGDLRDVEALIEKGDEKAKLAYDMMTYRLKKYIGAYYAILKRVDAIIFTGGVGENSDLTRAKVCADMEHFGIILDEKVNSVRQDGIVDLHKPESKIKILKVPTNEELEIALQTKKVIEESK